MDSSAVRTIDRIVAVLDCFTREQPAWSLTDLSAHLVIPKSTLHRFLIGMETHGLIRRDEGDRRWRLGYHLVVWGSCAAQSTLLRDLARPAICRLMEASGETAILTVYQNGEVVCLDVCESPHAVQLRMTVGMRRPAHAGASAKVLLAYRPEQEIETVIRTSGLQRLCDQTITDACALRRDLACIVEQGFAVSLEETDPGAWGVATPVFDERGQAVAAIGLAGPTLRYSPDKVEQWVALCREAAEDVGRMLGGR
jgi:IclR family transcriptional regulator, KDG regulon repressor